MTEITDLSPQDCLVAVMIAVSVADEDVRATELAQVAILVDNLPVFAGYDAGRQGEIGRMLLDLLEDEDGLDALFAIVRRFLPERLWETAYALSCDVAAADGHISEPEARLLEEIREELRLDRLHAAAIERGARARYMRA